MLRKLLIQLCIVLTSFTTVYAQYSSGISSFGLENEYHDVRYFGNDLDGLQLSVNYDYMISNRMMLGATFQIETAEGINNTYSSAFHFVPKLRYFISMNSLPIYAFVEPSFSFRTYQLETSDVKEKDLRVSPVLTGLGVSYFVRPQVALEAKLGLAFSYNNGADQGINNIFFNLNTKTFLYSETKGVEDNRLAESILQKGNLSFGGNLFFRRYYTRESFSSSFGLITQEEKFNEFYFSPRARYFLNDHLELEAFFNYFTNGESYDLGYEIKGSYYIRMKPHFYFKPSIGIKKRIESTLVNRYKIFTIPIEVNLEYFQKQKKYFVGTAYSIRSGNTLLSTYKFFGGMSYFIRKDVAITGQLDYDRSKQYYPTFDISIFPKNRSHSLSFSFGLNYWIL